MGSANSNVPKFIEKKVDVEQIKEEINEFPVVVYSKANCGYCTLAKELLDKENIRFREHDLEVKQREDPENAQRYLNGLVYVSKHRLVPQVFICGKFVGGYTELEKLHEMGLLRDEISRCSDRF